MAVIDPEGLFGGDRLRRCSNLAQLHWPRLYLASDGFARLELNLAKILGRAYGSFNPLPDPVELQAYLSEYIENFLLFPYDYAGQEWGQWDSPKRLLPDYKTANDKRSPLPPEPEFSDWKKRYRAESRPFAKCLSNVCKTFPSGVGVGVGVGVGIGKSKTTPSPPVPGGGVSGEIEPQQDFLLEAPEISSLAELQEVWFEQEFWPLAWRKDDKHDSRKVFKREAKTESQKNAIIAAVKASTAEIMRRDKDKRPYMSTWLNKKRFMDETETFTLHGGGMTVRSFTGQPAPPPDLPLIVEPIGPWACESCQGSGVVPALEHGGNKLRVQAAVRSGGREFCSCPKGEVWAHMLGGKAGGGL